MRLLVAGSMALAIASATALVRAQTPSPVTLNDLLARAGAYVTDFDAGFSHVVAEEHYEQRTSVNVLRGAHGGEQPAVRTLVSDFLLVKLPDQNVWLPFRDVFEVDGKPVRGRQDRLTKLFLQPAATAVQQAEQIVAESARYNIGVTRNINIPVLALTVLGQRYQPRFEFSHLKEDRKAGSGVWSIEYIERARPTLIRGAGGIDLITQGRLWIEASTGRVVKTELVNSERNMRATITTTYRFDSAFNLNVPVEMHEEYLLLSSGVSAPVTGTATYSNFRRFSVEVDERIRKDGPDVLGVQPRLPRRGRSPLTGAMNAY
jgi:hypothetical protein